MPKSIVDMAGACLKALNGNHVCVEDINLGHRAGISPRPDILVRARTTRPSSPHGV